MDPNYNENNYSSLVWALDSPISYLPTLIVDPTTTGGVDLAGVVAGSIKNVGCRQKAIILTTF